MSTLDINTNRENCPDMYALDVTKNFIQIGIKKTSDVYGLSGYVTTALTKKEATMLRDWLNIHIKQMGD